MTSLRLQINYLIVDPIYGPLSLFIIVVPLLLIQISSFDKQVVLFDSWSMTLTSSHKIIWIWIATCSTVADLYVYVFDALLILGDLVKPLCQFFRFSLMLWYTHVIVILTFLLMFTRFVVHTWCVLLSPWLDKMHYILWNTIHISHQVGWNSLQDR